MIHTTNLMIGNWVTYLEKPMQVVGIFPATVYLNFEGNEGDVFEIEKESVAGIPITWELLQECGFELGHDSTWRVGDTLLHQTRNGFELRQDGQFIEGLQFLNDLQNAYFILAKKKLNINL